MKKVSLRTRGRFMRVFLSAAERNGMPLVDANDNLLKTLRKRRDFDRVIGVLISMGFIAADPYNRNHPRSYKITDAGRCYFEKRAKENSERRWTRGLAIAAIIISIVTLILEFDDRGYLNWFKPERTSAGQEMPEISVSQ